MPILMNGRETAEGGALPVARVFVTAEPSTGHPMVASLRGVARSVEYIRGDLARDGVTLVRGFVEALRAGMPAEDSTRLATEAHAFLGDFDAAVTQ